MNLAGARAPSAPTGPDERSVYTLHSLAGADQDHSSAGAGTILIESALTGGQSLSMDMGVTEDDAAALVDSLRQDDYALIQNALPLKDPAAVQG